MIKIRILKRSLILLALVTIVGAQAQEVTPVETLLREANSSLKTEALISWESFIAPNMRIYPYVNNSYSTVNNNTAKSSGGVVPFIDSVTGRVFQRIIPNGPELQPSVTIQRFKVGDQLSGKAANYYYTVQLDIPF